jgi:LysR family transcriptional regulator, chromosome initiation inhibitor
MRYVAVASPGYIKRYLGDGFTARAAAAAQSLAWNRHNALQDMLVRKVFRRDIARPQHFVPTAKSFGEAVRAGLGWGMFPEGLAAEPLKDGSFVRIADEHLDVPLYWQCWKLDSPIVAHTTDAVHSAAAGLSQRTSLGQRPRAQ